MGFMDKAKQMAQQVQQEAKDGTLKERGKQMAAQAQQKLDEVQGQMASGGVSNVGSAPAVEYDQHGRPVTPPPAAEPTAAPDVPPTEAEVPAPAAAAETQPAADAPQPAAPAPPAAPKAPPAPDAGLTSGDPLAG